MNIKRIIAAAAAVSMLVMTAACGSKDQERSNYNTSDTSTGNTSPTGTYSDSIVAAKDGPKLSFSNVEAAPGETAEVSMYVKDADMKWNMCGIHVTFGEELECQMTDAKEQMIKYKKGSASEYATASVGMLWVDNLPEELKANHLGCLFFTEVFDGDSGQDGEIVKFFFKVPESAKSGTVYPIEIYYMTDNDIFINAAGDHSLEKYAFENWTAGSVTVK